MKVNNFGPHHIEPLKKSSTSQSEQVKNATDVQSAFRSFVGEAFFSQMLKSMRSSQGKPAYFHGGHVEQVFQGQLDQQLSEKLTESSAAKIADPMFRQQFPHHARVLESARSASLDDLAALRRH